MHSRIRRWAWPVAKVVLAMAILIAVGWQFWRDLHHDGLRSIEIEWPWLFLAGLMYLLGHAFSGWYWHRLLVLVGEKPDLPHAYFGYYISQLGKYLPGKAWAVMMRGVFSRGPNVKMGVTMVTTFFEVVTTMGSGAVLAAVWFTWQPPQLFEGVWNVLWPALAFVVVSFLAVLPGVFNKTVRRMARKYPDVQSYRLPPMRFGTMLEGLAVTCGTWICFGISLWAIVRGLAPNVPALTTTVLLRYTAIVAIAVVGGFVAVVVPGGIGVREWVLDQLLAPELTSAATAVQALTVASVVLLRLTWVAAELLAALLFWLFMPARRMVA